MKIYVVHASAGAGHLKAAEAVYKYLKTHCPQNRTEIVDILDKTSPFFAWSYKKGYTFLITCLPSLWYLAFWCTEAPFLRRLSRGVASFLNRLNTAEFADFIVRENPDVIVTTHFLPAEICANLKLKGKITGKVVSIITDYGVHPFWISQGVDCYLVASASTSQILARELKHNERIVETGIPVDEKFLLNYDKAGLRRKLGIREDKFTVLIMTGSFGLGPIEKITKLLHKDAQVLAVCARNKKLFEELSRQNLKDVKAFGFIDNANELMAASDLIVTKPGGLTISEVLALDLAPVFICAIPGQETENVRVLKEYGIGLSPRRPEEISKLVIELQNSPVELSRLKENISKLKKPHCLEEIRNAVC